jgi:hypothetical protein
MRAIKVKWEYEDNLPELSQDAYDEIYPSSEIIDGVRMYPYILNEKMEKVFLIL